MDKEALARVGHWGEEFAWRYLLAIEARKPQAGGQEAGSERGEVSWVNGEGETGSPYDLTITRPDGTLHYIEVCHVCQG